ncbi:MAG: 3-dehydroquinate synthase [Acidobacteriota bacterium]|nr:3-dehydroquinate synthase [Acidobacteriota bacterium]
MAGAAHSHVASPAALKRKRRFDLPSEMQEIKILANQKQNSYKIIVGRDILNHSSGLIKENLCYRAKKVAIISNRKVFKLYGNVVEESVKKAGFEACIYLMPDGEKHKNFKTLKKVIEFLSEQRMRRTDAIVAFGGGVVGDLVGFAAAVYLRGISYFQIPTTLLAMIDSSVGGKTGIDTEFGKNLVGAFYQPKGVLVDISVLKTLPRRELTSGFCEAIKQGALAGGELFNLTAHFLKDFPVKNFRQSFSNEEFLRLLEKLIARQIDFKASIVSQDEAEDVDRRDSRSRKILNFGHTIAHAIEKVTDYKLFKHGEAVGIGILIEAEISKSVANFPEDELQLLSDIIGLAGKLPACHNLDSSKILQAISFDKKNINDGLEWALLEKIGKPVILEGIPQKTLEESIKKFLKR